MKPTTTDEKRGRLGFLWFAIIAFTVMLAAWLALFIIASKNKVQEVPLEHTTSASLDLNRFPST